MSKQTAVQWLIEQIKEYDFADIKDQENYIIKIPAWVLTEKQEKAESMEKQQIKDAYLQGDEDGFHSTESQADYEIEGRSDYVSEQYFQSVYGQS
jgi:hypothetical protein